MKPQDFERLYEEHAGALYSFIAYRTGDRTVAEDVVADAFEKALRSRSRFDRRKASEKTWLYTIALNLLRDHARRKAAEGRALEKLPGTAPAADDPLARVDDRDQVGRALGILSDEERDALALRFGGGLTVPEIAKLLSEPLPRVEGRVYRALRKLRDELG